MELVCKLTAPDGGTEIGYALGAPARDSELAAAFGLPGPVVVLALLANASPKNGAARRFARVVLKGIPAARIAEASAALGLA
jgi:hypothetical protein